MRWSWGGEGQVRERVCELCSRAEGPSPRPSPGGRGSEKSARRFRRRLADRAARVLPMDGGSHWRARLGVPRTKPPSHDGGRVLETAAGSVGSRVDQAYRPVEHIFKRSLDSGIMSGASSF